MSASTTSIRSSESSLYRKATDGLLAELHDPYSVLLVEDDYKQLTETTTGNYGGLGIQIDVRDGWITVVAPLPDTPAERAGIETGDRIIEVDGKSTEGWNNERAVNALRGEPGSKVKIKIERAGIAEPVNYDLTRAQIHLRSVPGRHPVPRRHRLHLAQPGQRVFGGGAAG